MQGIPRNCSLPRRRRFASRRRSASPPATCAIALCAALSISLSGCKPATGVATGPAVKALVVPAAPVPPAPPQMAALPAGGVKAIYSTGWTAGSRKSLQRLVGIADRTTINAIVIDVKDDGDVTYRVDIPLAKEVVHKMPGQMKQIPNIDTVMATLQKHDIFPIARIACFRDTPVGNAHPELAVHNRAGGVWHDRKRNAWLNPYRKENWDYNVDLALDALKHGFKEIQFDYVRFPTDGRMSDMVFPGEPKDGKREDQIVAFLKYAHEKIHAAGGWMSADVFGLISMVQDDEGIGQKFVKIVENVDYLCPMVYPSHYAHGEYRLPNPNAEPYKLITYTVGDAKKRLATVKTDCKLRPWIQDFTLGSPRYGVAQVKAQIKALKDLGITEYCLWNAHNIFTEAAFAKEPATKDKMTAAAHSGAGSAPGTTPKPAPGAPQPGTAPTGAQPTESAASNPPTPAGIKSAEATAAAPDATRAAKKQ